MIATISPTASALRHTRNTLHYAGTASTITLAAPKAAEDDVELRNAELAKKNKQVGPPLAPTPRPRGTVALFCHSASLPAPAPR